MSEATVDLMPPVGGGSSNFPINENGSQPIPVSVVGEMLRIHGYRYPGLQRPLKQVESDELSELKHDHAALKATFLEAICVSDSEVATLRDQLLQAQKHIAQLESGETLSAAREQIATLQRELAVIKQTSGASQ